VLKRVVVGRHLARRHQTLLPLGFILEGGDGQLLFGWFWLQVWFEGCFGV
jgi:hypothetical protein